jgi:hypothetical protein
LSGFKRVHFTTSRELDFFTESALSKQIGHAPQLWPIALVKELIDNALDACEGWKPVDSDGPPSIDVLVGEDFVSVRDNGPGLPEKVIRESMDYTLRVSDKAHFISPTRGQMGNALKCVWAAPLVAGGTKQGLVEIGARGSLFQVATSIDQIAGKPEIDMTEAGAFEGPGTLVKMHWRGIKQLLEPRSVYDDDDVFGVVLTTRSLRTLIAAYASFNPHAGFSVASDAEDQSYKFEIPAKDPGWKKWLPGQATCPHWYTVERFCSLIAAFLRSEEGGGRKLTVREFVAMFRGLKGSAIQQAVLHKAKMSRSYLSDLAVNHAVDREAARLILRAMQTETQGRPVQPKKLGVIGRDNLTTALARYYKAAPENVRYRKVLSTADGQPFVLEAALGYRKETNYPRTVVAGINWSPLLTSPFDELLNALGEMRVDSDDPVALLVHLALPRPEHTDLGKGRMELPMAVSEALEECVCYVAQDWKKAKVKADRQGRITEQALRELQKANSPKIETKEAAFRVMEEAYLKASGDQTYPAEARQIMYVARELLQKIPGAKCWKQSSYFTQTLLPEFLRTHPELTADWDVVFGARGHLREPHTGRGIELGTVGVRDYVASWQTEFTAAPATISLDFAYPTRGPANRYRFALFVEKEGFNPLLARAQIQERYDVAIMSTKGMTVTAARHLVESLTEQGVTILVLHDFDKSGFSILHTMRSDTIRHRFRVKPNIIDIGLRLKDAQEMTLPNEQVHYKKAKKDPRIRLRECGATEEECNYLVRTSKPPWSGYRVELNAMTSTQFIEFLERKFAEFGVTKVVPEEGKLREAFEHAYRKAVIQKAVDQACSEAAGGEVRIPKRLVNSVNGLVTGTPRSWDDAIAELARNAVNSVKRKLR